MPSPMPKARPTVLRPKIKCNKCGIYTSNETSCLQCGAARDGTEKKI